MPTPAELRNGCSADTNIPLSDGVGLSAAGDVDNVLIGAIQRSMSLRSFTVSMNDLAHTLVLGASVGAQTRMEGAVMLVDAESSALAGENLTFPAEASLSDLYLNAINIGGENVKILNDAGVQVGTIPPSGVALITCDGTTLRCVVVGSTGAAAAGDLSHSDVTVSSAEILALNATPKTLVPPPGLGKAILFSHSVFFLDYNSAAYGGIAGGEDWCVRFTNGSGDEVSPDIETTGWLDQTSDQTRYAYAEASKSITPVANAALVLHQKVGEITTGDSPVKVRTYYRTIDTSW